MPHAADRQTPGPRARGSRRTWLAQAVALVAAAAVPGVVTAQATSPVEVLSLAAARRPDAVELDYQLRITLPPAVEEAARKGVPLYFVARATLWRSRWYWRDERIARVRREWRLTWQPLTSTWRVAQGGLGQSHASLDEAMSVMARASAWRIADAAQVDADARHYVEFDWELDADQLPRPLQIGLAGSGSDWALGVRRQLKIDASVTASAGGGAK